jgi:hypothetical protein
MAPQRRVAPGRGSGEVAALPQESNLPPASPFTAWETFYVIVGSSAGALTGLQFVVVALSAQSRTLRQAEDSLLAFGTPTVVHFCTVLLTAGIMAAPWGSPSGAAIALTLCGAGGLGYTTVVFLRARRQRTYAPVLEDWLWHTAFPAAGYLAETLAGLTLPGHPSAPFWLAGAALLLLFSGIHNAWDAAAYIALASAKDDGAAVKPPPPAAGDSQGLEL